MISYVVRLFCLPFPRALLLAGLSLMPFGPAWSNTVPQTDRWARPVAVEYNLYRMAPDLYRSALPDRQARARLERLGIRTVINFYQRSDADWLGDSSIEQIHMPLRSGHIDDEDVLAVLRVIREAQQKGPVLIHCKHGQNRTGLIAAMYRVIYDGWSKAEARAEMLEGGFGGGSRLKDNEAYLRAAPIARLRIALQRGACSTHPLAACAIKQQLFGMLGLGRQEPI